MTSQSPDQAQTSTLKAVTRRRALLDSLASLIAVLVAERLEDFAIRLGDALLNLSEQTTRPAEAQLSFNGFNYLRSRRADFQAAVNLALEAQLAQQLQWLGLPERAAPAAEDHDLSIQFEEMENRSLLANIAQALEQDLEETLDALCIRLASLLDLPELDAASNPFRPQVFVDAVFQGWCRIDPAPQSHKVMLRLIGPQLFLPLDAILKEVNRVLAEQGIVPDLGDAQRRKKARTRVGMPKEVIVRERHPHYTRVRDWLLAGMAKPDDGQGEEPEDLNLPDLFAAAGADGNWSPNTISVKVGPQLYGYLADLQLREDARQAAQPDAPAPASAEMLRQVERQVPPDTLTQLDRNTIELLARIFDQLLARQDLPDSARVLVGRMQLPMLKAALNDKKFFIDDQHPARTTLDTLVHAGLLLDPELGRDDPLYRHMLDLTQGLEKSLDQQPGLFEAARSRLETYLAQETDAMAGQQALEQEIAAALKFERTRVARQEAEQEISKRIDTGEVPGFLEAFLERQWLRILTQAIMLRPKRPELLQKALAGMDDLIWSTKPKSNAEERRRLVERLPSIVAATNAWLNALKWEGSERQEFFATLTERHVTIARMQNELSARQQVELAVNIAQRASERRIKKRYRQTGLEDKAGASLLIDGLQGGDWIGFTPQPGQHRRMRLSWVSPLRGCYILASRRAGSPPMTLSASELADDLGSGKATVLDTRPAVGRALTQVLESGPAVARS